MAKTLLSKLPLLFDRSGEVFWLMVVVKRGRYWMWVNESMLCVKFRLKPVGINLGNPGNNANATKPVALILRQRAVLMFHIFDLRTRLNSNPWGSSCWFVGDCLFIC